MSIAALATTWDIRTGKIPNRLIIIGLISGIIYRIVMDGAKGIFIFFLHTAWPVLLLYILFVQRSLGAGDIKLFGTLSAFFTTGQMISLILYSFLFGAVISLIKIIRFKQLLPRLLKLRNYVENCIYSKAILRYETIAGKSSYIRFSICILGGLITVLMGEIL